MEQFEVIARIAVAVVATVLSGLILYGLRYRSLQPRLLFIYMGIVVIIRVIWGWVLVAISLRHQSAEVTMWTTPISASLLVLLLVSVSLVVIWRIRDSVDD